MGARVRPPRDERERDLVRNPKRVLMAAKLSAATAIAMTLRSADGMSSRTTKAAIPPRSAMSGASANSALRAGSPSDRTGYTEHRIDALHPVHCAVARVAVYLDHVTDLEPVIDRRRAAAE